MPNRDGALAPITTQIERAEALLAEREMRSAIATAQAASEIAQQLAKALADYREIRSAIVQGRKDAEALVADGYRMDASHAALDQAREALAAAAAAIQRGELPTGPLDTARRGLAQAYENGPGLVQLREENTQRIAALEQRGQQVAALIAQGQQSFELVDDFAESTWSDIRGNGSEAQKAADQAQALWERAAADNSMEAQDFVGARDDLAAATALLDRATTLIEAILARLRDLQGARAAAQEELAAAAADITAGQQFISTNDPDVTEGPEQRLQQAVALLQQAQAEASKEQPDWLTLVRLAQAANAEADAALAAARSEVEALNKLRAQIARAQQVALGEVQKVEQFVAIHTNDIAAEGMQALNDLREQTQRAAATLQAATSAEDEARRTGLEDAFSRYTRLQESAGQVYRRVYDNFQRAESMRAQLGEARGRAALALNEATRLAGSYGSFIPPNAEPLRLIERANALLNQLPTRSEGEATLRALIDAAQQARADAEQAAQLIRSQYARTVPNPGPIVFGELAGPILGELLEQAQRGGRRRRGGLPPFGGFPDPGDFGGWGNRGSSGGGGGGGSRSGGSWGGGSKSGGSWGGGSKSGGSWGGGSKSGGGW